MTARPQLLVLDDWEGRIAGAPAQQRLSELADVRFLDAALTDAPDDELHDVQVVLAIRERTRLDADALARLPRLELLLQTGGHGYHIDTDTARHRGILIALGRRAVAARAAVPELTFALMIGAMRHLGQAQHEVAAGRWPSLIGRCLSGRRLGLLGVGRHGAQVARIAEAFGMEVIAWDRPGSAAADDLGVQRVDLDTLLRSCDVVSVHLRLSPESTGLLDADRLNRCKPGAVLVNTARGAIVDETALVTALREGPLAAAGLDVFTDEPLPAHSALRAQPNVVLTPHIGWTVEEVFDEFAAIAADQLDDYLSERLDPAELLDPVVADVERHRCGSVGVRPS